MLDFYQKRKLKSIANSPLTLVVVLLICVPVGMSVYERYTVEREMAERREEMEADRQELLERKESLEERVEYLEDERGIESEIRRNFDVAKEGEQVVIILEEDATATVSPPEPLPEPPWWMFWR